MHGDKHKNNVRGKTDVAMFTSAIANILNILESPQPQDGVTWIPIL